MISARALWFFAIGSAFIVALPHSSWTTEMNAESLLKTALSKYSELDSYSIEFVRYDETAERRSIHHSRISFRRPASYRVEDLAPPQQSEGDYTKSSCTRMIDIIDGKTRWSISPDLRQYSNRAIDLRLEDPAAQLALRLPQTLQNVELAPDATVVIGGSPYECTVVSVSSTNGSTMKYWIDKSKSAPVQWTLTNPPRRTSVKVQVYSVDVNPVLKADLFAFEPPPDWHQNSVYSCTTHR